MPRVICDLPNASDEINGIKFHPLDDGGLISDEIDAETAANFASIPGYSLDDGSSAPAPEPVKPVAPKTRQAAKPKTRQAAKPKKAEAAPPAAPAVVEKPLESAATVEHGKDDAEQSGDGEGAAEVF